MDRYTFSFSGSAVGKCVSSLTHAHTPLSSCCLLKVACYEVCDYEQSHEDRIDLFSEQ
jgi:hypothetical protein